MRYIQINIYNISPNEGLAVGYWDIEGLSEGNNDGLSDGIEEGLALGTEEGIADGAWVGKSVGSKYEKSRF